ncbi:MAG: serine hydrolase domain-containing protein [Christensenellales bacterium]|jgi:CubicO group peptidase (beta-lactamase class C family)
MGTFLSPFMAAIAQKQLGVLAVMVYQDGALIDEARIAPDVPHNLYSFTKSFTSTAVGMAIDEGRLRLEDRVCDLLGECLPAHPDPKLERLQLRHLLTMASGHDQSYLLSHQRAKLKDGWIAHYLSQSLPYEPGDRFNYDSGDTYLAGCMLRRATGQTVREYLTGRLFEPLGIRVAHWEVAPCGNQFGGGGLWLRTRDAAKLPLLYLNQGQWQGRQLVSAAYVARASAKQIDTFNPGDGGFGYGFQFWRGSHNSYRADGAYSQLGIVLPEKRAVVMINSLEKKNGQGILDTVWEEILPRL